jgi:hypothetical protein
MSKQILNINDVFSQITPAHTKYHNILVNGQYVPLSRNLILLHQLSNLTCSMCGCNGTHLQQFFQLTKNGRERELWRVMTWSKSFNKISFLNIDHIIPVSHGGKNDLTNFRVTCHECNCARGNSMNTVEMKEPCVTMNDVVQFIRKKFKNLSKLNVKIKVFVNSVKKRIDSFFLDLTNSETISTLIKCLTFVGIGVQADFFQKLILLTS